MTAEVVVMNKNAVAIAADSVVTVHASNSTKLKTYNTVNKLFQLSLAAPVAIMVYGNAEISGLPWETVIKQYRRQLQDKTFATVEEYGLDFINYLRQMPLSNEDDQYSTSAIIYQFALTILGKTKYLLSDLDLEADNPSEEELCEITTALLDDQLSSIEEMEVLPGFEAVSFSKLAYRYRKIFGKAIELIQEELCLKKKGRRIVWKMLLNLLIRRTFTESASGIVITGFGENELFPALVSYVTDGYINDVLKITEEENEKISRKSGALIIPFAQSEMVYRFMEGVDSNYQRFLGAAAQEMMLGIADVFANAYIKGKQKREVVKAQLRRAILESLRLFDVRAEQYRQKNFVGPIIDSVKSLPKEELGTLAEALVKLTSLKRRMSTDVETVGEPIDVAVISKGDGLVWIKRKHYFDPALNARWIGNAAK